MKPECGQATKERLDAKYQHAKTFLQHVKPVPDAKSVLISPPGVAIDHLFPHYTKEKVQAFDQWFEYETCVIDKGLHRLSNPAQVNEVADANRIQRNCSK